MMLRNICSPVLAALTLILHASAQQTNSTAPFKIGAADATRFFGREMIVTGVVAQVSVRPKIVFINMDKPYPESPLALVIFPAATNQFGDLRALKGMPVEVTGTISNYHDHAEIVLEHSKQLKIVGGPSTKAP